MLTSAIIPLADNLQRRSLGNLFHEVDLSVGRSPSHFTHLCLCSIYNALSHRSMNRTGPIKKIKKDSTSTQITKTNPAKKSPQKRSHSTTHSS